MTQHTCCGPQVESCIWRTKNIPISNTRIRRSSQCYECFVERGACWRGAYRWGNQFTKFQALFVPTAWYLLKVKIHSLRRLLFCFLSKMYCHLYLPTEKEVFLIMQTQRPGFDPFMGAMWGPHFWNTAITNSDYYVIKLVFKAFKMIFIHNFKGYTLYDILNYERGRVISIQYIAAISIWRTG